MLILGTVLGAAVSLAIALVTPPNYMSQVTLIVTPPVTATPITFGDVEVTQALAPTFAELSTTAPLLQRVLNATGADLDIETLARSVTTHVPVGTSLVDISVVHRDPAIAAAIANAIAAELVSYPAQGLTQQPTALNVVISVVDPAVPPKVPQGLGILPRTILGGAIGLLISISLAFFVENVGRGAQSLGRGVESAGRKPSSASYGRAETRPVQPVVDWPTREVADGPPTPERDSTGRFLGGRSKSPGS